MKYLGIYRSLAERLHFHFSLSCTGEGNGSPLQCSCLENPRDGGAWWAAVYGVAQSRTRLKGLSSSSSSSPSEEQCAHKHEHLCIYRSFPLDHLRPTPPHLGNCHPSTCSSHGTSSRQPSLTSAPLQWVLVSPLSSPIMPCSSIKPQLHSVLTPTTLTDNYLLNHSSHVLI